MDTGVEMELWHAEQQEDDDDYAFVSETTSVTLKLRGETLGGTKRKYEDKPQALAAPQKVVYECRHPECTKRYASWRGAFGHAQKRHPDWFNLLPPQGGCARYCREVTEVPQAAVPRAAVPQAAVPQAAVPRAAVPRAAVSRAAVPRAPQLSDDEAKWQAAQEGLPLLKSENKAGLFGVYGWGATFSAKVMRTVEGRDAKTQVYLGNFASRFHAALCVARTDEGKAQAAAVAASGGRLSNGTTGAQAPRWDAEMRGASQWEEREEAKKARLGEEEEAKKAREEAKEAREEAKAREEAAKKAREEAAKKAREETQSKAEADRLLAFCKAQEQAVASKEEAQERREAGRRRRERREERAAASKEEAQKRREARKAQRERQEDAERTIEQAVMEQKDGGCLKKETRDTLHGFNDVSTALRAKALTLLSRDRAAQILAVTACKRSHVLGVPQLAALGAPPLPRASLSRRAPGGEPKHASLG